MTQIILPPPDLQISFALALKGFRGKYLQEALSETVRNVPVPTIDKELADLVPAEALSELAQHGIRGELVFPVPSLILGNPHLIGYYRMLLGYSQKAFYDPKLAGRFVKLETHGVIRKDLIPEIGDLCKAMIKSAVSLLLGMGDDQLSIGTLDDLTLLTLGPQLRGGANVNLGTAAILRVFNIIKHIVEPAIVKSDQKTIELKNSSGRTVLIAFSSDPDIVIRETMSTENFRNIIAIEVKGGTDASNIHNRVGEAEKSHLKAKQNGYTDLWTIINVDRPDAELKKESATTTRFYRLENISDPESIEYTDFKQRVIGAIGIEG